MNLETDNSSIKRRDSLIQRDEQQPTLFTSAEMDSKMFKAAEDKGEFTGERLYKKDPGKYKIIVALSAEGMGVRRMGALLGVSPNTILAVQAREGEAIDTVKETIARLSRAGARMCADELIERLFNDEDRKKISSRDLAIIEGVLVDKSQLLGGGATARVHVTGNEPGPDDFNRTLAEALVKRAAEKAATGSDSETQETKGNDSIDADFTMVDDEDPPGPGESSDQEPEPGADSAGEPGPAPASDHLSGANSEEQQQKGKP